MLFNTLGFAQEKEKILSRKEFILASALAVSGILFINPSYAIAETNKPRQYIDSLGRVVPIGGSIESVLPKGISAQTIMSTLCPHGLVALAKNVDEDGADYAASGLEDLLELPKVENMPLRSEDPSAKNQLSETALFIDIGVPKQGLAEELDGLQAETGIPCVFIDISFGLLSAAYRELGVLLGCEERAETLATYIEGILVRASGALTEHEDAPKVFYAQRQRGLEARGGIEIQLNALSFLGAQPVVAPYDFERKRVDETILKETEIDLVLFDDTDAVEALTGTEESAWDEWSGIAAIDQGRFIVAPALMHSWFGSLVFAQSLGLLWLASSLWPDLCNFEIEAEADSFYRLFYDLSKGNDYMSFLLGENVGMASANG